MAEKKARPTPEQLTAAYKDGTFTAAEYHDKMRRLASANLGDIIENQGVFKSYFTETIRQVQQNWNEFIDIATEHDPTESTKENLKLPFKLMWREIGLLTAPMTAFGEVNGKKAEQLALQYGASPGLAKVINIAVDVGSGFVPVAGTVRSAVKGLQKAIPSAAASVAKVTGKAAAGKTVVAPQIIDKVADDALVQGLAAEGVQGLERFVDDADELVKAAVKQVGPPDDFYKSLRKYYNEIKDVTETKHLADIEKEADKLGIHLDDLKALAKDKPLTPAEIKAYLKTLDEPTTNLIDNARRVLKGEPDAGPLQDKLLSEYFQYTPKFRAAEVGAGRTVKVLDADPRMKSITDMMSAWDPESMAKLDLPAARRTIAEDLVALADEQEKLKALQVIGATSKEATGPTFWTAMREAYVNLLLARPVTQVRNFLGNSYAAVNSAVERELAGWLSIDRANGVVKGEGMRQLQGMTAAIGDGITAFKDAYTKIGPEEASKLDFIPHQIQGRLGRIVNVPGDTLRGMDNFFKTVLQRGDMYATAMQQGTHAGLAGRDLADYVARRVNVPTASMLEHAKDFALNQTFQNDLGTLGKWAQGIQRVPGLVYLFPFMKTPMNLAKYAWNRTPGLQLLSQSLYQDILAGGTRADMAIARLTLSNMMGLFWYGLAKEGLITGGGPADPTLRRSWLGTKQPYSILGKDSWYPMTGMEPATTTVNLIADFAEIHNQIDDPTAEQTAMAIALAGVRDIVDKSYWQTVGQMVEFIGAARAGEEPGRNALRIAQSPLVTALSGGPLAGAVARALDPVRREARGFVDQVRSRVPGFSADLPPMRDGYGDPLLPPPALGADWVGVVSPFVYKPEELDPIKKEGARLQAKLPMFPWSLGGKVRDDFDIRTAMPGDELPVELTPQQRDRWQVIYRNILRHPETGMEALMQSEEYQKATWAQQRELFMGQLAKSRAAAKESLMVEDVELAKKATVSKVAAVLPLLNEEDRTTAREQTAQELDLLDSLAPDEKDNLLKYGILESGEARDREVIEARRGPIKAEINKSIPELNRAANP